MIVAAVLTSALGGLFGGGSPYPHVVALLLMLLGTMIDSSNQRREREASEREKKLLELALELEQLRGDQSIMLCAHAYKRLGWRLRRVDEARLLEARVRTVRP